MSNDYMVQKYIWTSYDHVKYVSDNMDKIISIASIVPDLQRFHEETLQAKEDTLNLKIETEQIRNQLNLDVVSATSLVERLESVLDKIQEQRNYIDSRLQSTVSLNSEVLVNLAKVENLSTNLHKKLLNMINVIESFYPLDKLLNVFIKDTIDFSGLNKNTKIANYIGTGSVNISSNTINVIFNLSGDITYPTLTRNVSWQIQSL